MAGSYDYRKAWRRIRGFVDLGYDPKNLTPSQKGQVRKYDEEIRRLRARKVVIYRARNPKNLAAVQKQLGQHSKGFPHIKVAFVPVTDPGKRPRIRVSKRGTAYQLDNGIARRVHRFVDFMTPRERASDSGMRFTDDGMRALIGRILAKDKQSVVFSRVCGKYEDLGSGRTRRNLDLLVAACMAYIRKYDNNAEWFDGIVGYSFHAQEDFQAYRDSRGFADRKRKKRRKGKPKSSRDEER